MLSFPNKSEQVQLSISFNKADFLTSLFLVSPPGFGYEV